MARLMPSLVRQVAGQVGIPEKHVEIGQQGSASLRARFEREGVGRIAKPIVHVHLGPPSQEQLYLEYETPQDRRYTPMRLIIRVHVSDKIAVYHCIPRRLQEYRTRICVSGFHAYHRRVPVPGGSSQGSGTVRILGTDICSVLQQKGRHICMPLHLHDRLQHESVNLLKSVRGNKQELQMTTLTAAN